MSVFGDRLRYIRKKKSLTVLELSTELNKRYNTTISKSMISRYENGKTDPKLDYVRIIADYFNVSANYLIGLDDKEYEPDTLMAQFSSEKWTESERVLLEEYLRFIINRREERKKERNSDDDE